MSCQITLDERPTYVHARLTAERTPENLVSFLQAVTSACDRTGRDAALLEMRLSGPSLSTSEIYEVISQRALAGRKLRKIAYVEALPGDPDLSAFAETVARNRGINVRLFSDAATAANWLAGKE